jgi:putative transcriptional regulator
MSIAAIKSLRRRHVDLQHAKRTVEHMMMHRKAIIHVPKLECFGTLAAELAAANVTATMLPDEIPDVAAIRARLKMTQEQFAQRYGLELASIRNWEHGRRKPDTAAISYLRVIANDPAAVEQALWGRVAASGIAPQQPS